MTAPSSLVPIDVALQEVWHCQATNGGNGGLLHRLASKLGVPQKVVETKLLSLASRGYIEYGVSVGWPWLTEKGKQRIDLPFDPRRVDSSPCHL